MEGQNNILKTSDHCVCILASSAEETHEIFNIIHQMQCHLEPRKNTKRIIKLHFSEQGSE